MAKVIMDNREMPSHAVGTFDKSDDISDLLPRLAKLAGLELRSVTFRVDPVILYDKFGHILYEWPCEYEPSWVEVHEVVQQVL